MIGKPSKVRSERADLGISDSLVHLHTGVLPGLDRRLSNLSDGKFHLAKRRLQDPGRHT